ncbi:MAG TPA: histone deacetylase [Acidimicrobiales bacterium]|nr:histone deacetylase [Acidimicrobiales bacterium]
MILFGSLSGIDRHSNWPGHPEGPGRLPAVEAGIRTAGLGDLLASLTGRPARRDELARVHSEAYLDALAGLDRAGGGELDPDTAMSAGSLETAVAAAGMGLAAVEALERGEADSAFVAVRPPGHHATTSQAMGFCLLNNVAVAAAALVAKGQRVMILDWDVHHGNGTQDIFWDDPLVLYVSTHQWPAYPGTGRAAEVGGGAARGLTVNVPMPPGSTGDAARLAMEKVVAPVAESFVPDWLLISAGFDAHRDDPMADLAWTAGDFADLTRDAVSLMPRPGRTVAFLEGGYDLGALALSSAAAVAALVGVDYRPEAPSSGGPGWESVLAAGRIRERQLSGGEH